MIHDYIVIRKKAGEKMSVAKELLTPANIISFLRVPLAILVVIFFEEKYLAFTLLLIAVFSDALDGYVAKKTKTTATGALVDPMCDKLFILVIIEYLLFSSNMTFGAFLLLAMREIYLLFIFILLSASGSMDKAKHYMKARFLGKVTTVLQFITLCWIVLDFDWLHILIYLTAVSSIITMADYSAVARKAMMRHRQSGA